MYIKIKETPCIAEEKTAGNDVLINDSVRRRSRDVGGITKILGDREQWGTISRARP